MLRDGEAGPATEMKPTVRGAAGRRVLDDCESLADGEQGHLRIHTTNEGDAEGVHGKVCTWHVT